MVKPGNNVWPSACAVCSDASLMLRLMIVGLGGRYC